MSTVVETRLKKTGNTRTQAIVRVMFEGWSFTVSGIMIYMEGDGKWRLSMPMSSAGTNKRPAITMQGKLRKAVSHVLSEDQQAMLKSGEKLLRNSHVFSQDLSMEIGTSSDHG